MKKVTLIGDFKNKESQQVQRVWLPSIQSSLELEPYISSLVDCYKEVFAGPPYFEKYDGQEETFIIPSFRRFAEAGILVLLVTDIDIQNGTVIGFGAGIDAENSEAAEFLKEHAGRLEAPLRQHLYMAELGVLPAFQGQGLGTQLVRARIEKAIFETATRSDKFFFTHLVMRTASVGSNSAQIYLRLGAKQIDGLVQQKNEFGTKSSERIFLAAPLASLH